MKYKPVLRAATALATLPVLCATLPLSAALAQSTDQSTAIDQTALEEIVVTGSYIRRKSQFDSPSPIQVLGSEQLEQIGASTIAELTQTLTINNGAQNNADAFTQNRTTGTENINLRGLGVQSTLVLLNGRRQVGSASPTDSGLSFVDTSALVPLIAVDRVEVLKDGAAALYGTDAVAGVVNFITRDDFEGLELEAEFQTVTEDSSHDLRVSGIWGAGNDRTHFIVAGSYFDRTELTSRERDLRRGADQFPNLLSISTQTAFPPNVVIPAATPQLFGALGPEGFAAYQAAFNTNTALFNFGALPGAAVTGLQQAGVPIFTDPNSGAALGALPVIPNPLAPGNFLVGNFASFTPSAALPFGDPLGLADAFTGQGLPNVLPIAIPGFNLGLLSPEQQLAFQQTIGATVAAQGGFDTPIVPDPTCQQIAGNVDDDIRFLPASQVGGVGLCALDFGPFFALVPEEERVQGYTKIKHQLTDTVEVFAELSYARNRATRNTSNFPISSPVPVAANYPFNPFGQPVFAITRSPGTGQLTDFFTDRQNDTKYAHDTYRVSTGARGDISDTWYFDFAFTRGVNDFSLESRDGVASNFALALQGLGGFGCDPATGTPGVGPCQFYNLFGTGAIADPSATTLVRDATGQPVLDGDGNPITVPVRNSQEILEFITSPITFDSKSKLNVVDAVVSGDLFDWSAGTVGAAFGFQYRDESLSSDQDQDTNEGDRLFLTQPADDFAASRDVWALFAEFNIPLMENLELSTAVRYEKYSDNAGDTLDPKVSLLYRPHDRVTFRGSFGTAFRAPSLFQTFGNQVSLNSVNDPLTGGAPFIAIRTNGNENLRPEESTTYNLGVSVEPVDNLEFSLDFWSFDFDNVIAQVPADQIVFLEATGGTLPPGTLVSRGVTGGLSTVVTLFTNDNKIQTNGLDFSAAYTFDLDDFGTLRLGMDGTWVNKYDITGFDGIEIDGAGRTNRTTFADPVAELRTNWSALWANGGHSGAVFVRRIGKLLDDRTSEFASLPSGLPDLNNVVTPVNVDSHTTVDLQYSYNFDGEWGPLKGAGFTVGAINVFDKAPPFVNVDNGFETRTHDPRGRLVYFKVKVGF